jgi:hypothetical protein
MFDALIAPPKITIRDTQMDGQIRQAWTGDPVLEVESK